MNDDKLDDRLEKHLEKQKPTLFQMHTRYSRRALSNPMQRFAKSMLMFYGNELYKGSIAKMLAPPRRSQPQMMMPAHQQPAQQPHLGGPATAGYRAPPQQFTPGGSVMPQQQQRSAHSAAHSPHSAQGLQHSAQQSPSSAQPPTRFTNPARPVTVNSSNQYQQDPPPAATWGGRPSSEPLPTPPGLAQTTQSPLSNQAIRPPVQARQAQSQQAPRQQQLPGPVPPVSKNMPFMPKMPIDPRLFE
jgi:hypothetical protein